MTGEPGKVIGPETLGDKAAHIRTAVSRLLTNETSASARYLALLAGTVVGAEHLSTVHSKEELLLKAGEVLSVSGVTKEYLDTLSQKTPLDVDMMLVEGVGSTPLLELKNKLKEHVTSNSDLSRIATFLISN